MIGITHDDDGWSRITVNEGTITRTVKVKLSCAKLGEINPCFVMFDKKMGCDAVRKFLDYARDNFPPRKRVLFSRKLVQRVIKRSRRFCRFFVHVCLENEFLGAQKHGRRPLYYIQRRYLLVEKNK